MPLLNDVQSQLNATEVARVVTPATVQEIGAVIAEASAQGLMVCPAGALHSMGGQQFARGGISVSSSRLTKIRPSIQTPQTCGCRLVSNGRSW